MYTQCPDCQIAFRVTADVLQQAGGQVQCGGCGNSFNAVDHLSEMPPPPASDSVAAAKDPTVEPEQSFEERSSELLKALDDLAGPDEVRIEDTGIEWRVLGDEEDADEPEPGISNDAASDFNGSMDWHTDNTQDGESGIAINHDDAIEHPTAENMHAPQEQAAPDLEDAPLAEPRYDDSTPLPDDYGDDDDDPIKPFVHRPPIDEHDTEVETEEYPLEAEDPRVDLALGDPDEWMDLLDEVVEVVGADVAANAALTADGDAHSDTSNAELLMETEEELAAIHNELSTALTRNNGADDLSTEPGAAADDLDAAEQKAMPDDNLSAAREDPEADLSDDEETPPEIDDVADDDEALELTESDDEDSNLVESAHDSGHFDLTEAANDDELVLANNLDDEGTENADRSIDRRDDDVYELDDEFELADEDGMALKDVSEPGDNDSGQSDDDLEDSVEADRTLDKDAEATDFQSQITLIETSLSDDADSDDEDSSTVIEQDEYVAEHDIEKELAARADAGDQKRGDRKQLHDDMLRAMNDQSFAASMTAEDGSPMIETIVMEGDIVHGSIEVELDDLESKLPPDLEEPKSLIDTYVLNRRGGGGRFFSMSGNVMTVGVVVLILLLAAQYVHTSREYLATYGTFNQTIGPVYRVLGKPVTPAWDIKGWQFETTNGSTDEGEQLLTIYSDIANRSGQALPYPLVHVSLTDRFEEIVGSRVLEPNEYLAGNPDPRRPVAPGDKFTAVVTVATPSPDVTGFKLNVCYRVDVGRLSCAIEDFKN